MKGLKAYCILILLVALVALALRLPHLDHRPLHVDEAVNALKFGQLLEERFYRYDPHEYHGPTLNYLTLICARITSAQKLSEIDESTLRIVPVLFGILLVLTPLLLADGLSKPAIILAAAFTAVSPAMVFYSRYYIHEMLLVCFTFGAIVSACRYSLSKNIGWAVLTGLFFGLMHATKETCIIAFASMFLAFLLALMVRHSTLRSIDKGLKFSHILTGLATAVAVSALFYSSFFTNPDGILDSARAYLAYFSRAGRDVSHIHPWYYYLKMLMYSRYNEGPIWSEAPIVILAVVGFVVAIAKKSSHDSLLPRFIAFYTLIITAVYSVIPYKTPWCLLSFFHGMILLAAIGAAALIKIRPNLFTRTIIGLILVAASAHLAWQAYSANYKFFADSRNPYVYAHSTTDVFDIARRVEQIARAHPDGRDMHIQVICPYNDYWPLPWYLRSFTNVGWYDKVDNDVPVAPLIIISPAVESAVSGRLYELPGKKNLYVPIFEKYTQLRPHLEVRAFVTKDLWDSFQVMKDDSASSRD
jgi:uncharacterized protein (TIGR03663 family)